MDEGYFFDRESAAVVPLPLRGDSRRLHNDMLIYHPF